MCIPYSERHKDKISRKKKFVILYLLYTLTILSYAYPKINFSRWIKRIKDDFLACEYKTCLLKFVLYGVFLLKQEIYAFYIIFVYI